ncbi:ribonuclease H-like domain-containing protein [Tanacetum coccineum]
MAGSNDENPPPPQTLTQQAPHTVSTIKLHILKKGGYDIWAMKMEHYLSHTDYPIWEVIQKGNGPVSVSTDTNGVIKVLPPKTAEEILARERERKARTTLLMALPEDHLAKFHKMTDAKEMFQSLLSQLEIHGAGVSTEDANQKFLRVFESDVKGSTGSSSSAQNVAFVSSESTSSTNDVSTAYGVSTSSGYNSQRENSSSYTDELMYSFFANQSSGPQLDHEDLEQLDEFDLEEMDLKWQVAMISMRLKKFYKKTGRRLQFDAKEPVGFDKTKVECFNCHKTGHFARECRSKGNQESRRRDAGNTGYKAKDNGRRPGKQEEPKALVTLDGEGVDWTGHAEDEQENFALMAYSNSGSDTEVTSCSKECVESYAKLKKLYDEQREQLGDASIEIQAYTQALKKKVLKKFNYFDCIPVSTPMDTSKKLMPSNGQTVSQLEYSRVIGCLIYAMTCTRPGIAFAVGKLSKYTSNPGTQHWQAIQRVLKYLKKTMDYRLTYTGYPSVLEVAGKEAEWLKNLLLEIPVWSKPIAPISIRCDSVATLAKAYSQMYGGMSRHLRVMIA